MSLFDSNVLLDIATADPVWLAWSERQFRTAVAQGPIFINPIIHAELFLGVDVGEGHPLEMVVK